MATLKITHPLSSDPRLVSTIEELQLRNHEFLDGYCSSNEMPAMLEALPYVTYDSSNRKKMLEEESAGYWSCGYIYSRLNLEMEHIALTFEEKITDRWHLDRQVKDRVYVGAEKQLLWEKKHLGFPAQSKFRLYHGKRDIAQHLTAIVDTLVADNRQNVALVIPSTNIQYRRISEFCYSPRNDKKRAYANMDEYFSTSPQMKMRG